jgi:hypothetical protein
MSKIGRNEKCPCGSGKKHKHCHGKVGDKPYVGDYQRSLDRRMAAENIRQAQQGLGKPIIAQKLGDIQLVAVGSKLHWSAKWRTFPDFLEDYIKTVLGAEWYLTELQEHTIAMHPLMQWYIDYQKVKQKAIKIPGEIFEYSVTGVVACYLGVAYALYLLDHNVELQKRLVARLKDVGNFQGAYYELWVARILIHAGFKLTLEDETDGNSRHCEFAAVSNETGKRYWVEAKMKAYTGLLGRSGADSGTNDNPISSMIPQLNDALDKPAADDRLIFIDLNAPHVLDAQGRPDWLERASRRLEKYEQRELAAGKAAYVFLTNLSFHRHLDEPTSITAAPFGLGLTDFPRPGPIHVVELYKRKLKHMDSYSIGDAIARCSHFPTTLDGKLPSDSFGKAPSRVTIGQIYHFEGGGEGGADVIGEVLDVQVLERAMFIMVRDLRTRRNVMIRGEMSDLEFAEYREFGLSSFGAVDTRSEANSPLEAFEFLMKTYKETPRSKIEESLPAGIRESLKHLADDELRMLYCEGLLWKMMPPSQNSSY